MMTLMPRFVSHYGIIPVHNDKKLILTVCRFQTNTRRAGCAIYDHTAGTYYSLGNCSPLCLRSQSYHTVSASGSGQLRSPCTDPFCCAYKRFQFFRTDAKIPQVFLVKIHELPHPLPVPIKHSCLSFIHKLPYTMKNTVNFLGVLFPFFRYRPDYCCRISFGSRISDDERYGGNRKRNGRFISAGKKNRTAVDRCCSIKSRSFLLNIQYCLIRNIKKFFFIPRKCKKL